MSTFGTGTTTTGGSSIVLTAFSGTNGVQAGTDGLVPGPAVAQQGYILGAGGDWVLTIKEIEKEENGQVVIDVDESSNRIATTAFVQTLIGNAQLGGGNANLSALGDTQFANLAADQFLQYNGNKWANVTFTLGTISDVDLAGLNDGNALVYSAAANGGAGGWVPGEGGGGGAESLNALSDVTIAGGAENHFLVRNAQGQYVNRLISTADLSNSDKVVLTNADATFGNHNYDFTGATTITVPAPTQDTHASTKKYVDDEISGINLAGKQDADASLDTITGIADGDLLLGNNPNSFEKISVQAGVETFLKGTGSVGTLSDVDLAQVGNGKILKYDNGSFVAVDETDTNTQLTDNQVKDIVGQQMLGGDESGITVSYDAVNRNIDFAVSLGGFSVRDLSDVSNDALVNGKILKVQNGVLTQVDETDTNTQRTDAEIQTVVGGMVSNNTETGITVTAQGDGTLDFEVSLAGFSVDALSDVDTTTNAPQNGEVLKWDGNNFVPSADTGKTQAEIEDIVGGMVDGNTETGIAVSYDPADNTLDFVVDNTTVGFLGGVQTFTGNKTFTGNVDLTNATATGATQQPNNNSSSLATTEYVDTQIDTDINALDLANNYQAKDSALDDITGIADKDLLLGDGANSFEKISVTAGAEAILRGSGSVGTLSDTTLQAGAVGDVLRVSAVGVVGGVADIPTSFVNTKLASSDLSDGSNIVLNNAGKTFGAFAYDFTASTVTVKTPANATDATTKTYVDTQVATKQTSDATLTALTGLATGVKKIIYSNTADNDLEMISLSDNAKTFIGSDAELGDLEKVDIAANIGNGNDGETLRWDGANLEWKNSKLAFGDLNQNVGSTQNVALLNGNNQTFSGVNIFTNDITATTAGKYISVVEPTADAHVANKKYVDDELDALALAAGNVSDLDDLTDVNLGVKVVEVNGQNVNDGVALADAHILVYDSDGGVNDNTFKNVPISGDITLARDGEVTIGAGKVSNAKLANSSLSIGSTSISLGSTSTTLSGMTAIDFTNANATIGATMTDDGAGTSTVLTLGGAGSTVAITGTLTVNAPVNNTDATTKSYVDTQVGTKQTSDATLTALAGLATGAKKLIYSNTGDNDLEMISLSDKAKTFIGTDAGLNNLDDVVIAGVANAQILVADITDDGNDANDKFKNVTLSGDITILNDGTATIGNDKITTDKINDGDVTNAKLANSSLTIGSTAISLGGTSTTLSGMTAIDFTNANATIGASITTDGGNPAVPRTLTLGGAGSKVIIAGDLQVSGSTTTVDTANMVIEDRVISLNSGVAGANGDDIGLFFDRGTAHPALFIWDESETVFKVGTENGATASQAGDYALTLSGLEVASPAQGDDSNLASTTAWVTDYFQPLDATLTALGLVATASNKLIYATDADTFATTDITAFARSILDDGDAPTVRATLQLGTASLSAAGDFLASNAGLNNLDDVLIAGVANAQILVYDADGGANDTKWKNVSLGTDLTISNTGVATISGSAITTAKIEDEAVTTAKIKDGDVTNAKLANSSLTIGSAATSLGGSTTTLSGMTGIDFTNANATIGASMTTLNGQSTTLTLGGATSTVAVAGKLTLPNAPNGGTEATNKTYVDGLITDLANDYQPLEATLTALALVETVADRLIYATDADTFAVTTFTAKARELLDDATFGAMRTTLGLGDVATLDTTIAGGAGDNGKVVITDGNGKLGAIDGTNLTGVLLEASNLSDLANNGTARDNLGLGDVATLDTTITGGAGDNGKVVITDAQGKLGAIDGTNLTGVLLEASNLSDLADNATARTNLGLGTASTQSEDTFAKVANNLSDLADNGTARTNLGLGNVATLNTTITGGNADAGKVVITDGNGKLGAIDGANLTALGSIALHSNVDLTNIAHGQGLVYSTTDGVNRFEPGTVPTTGTDLNETPTITAQSISLNPNANVGGDLLIYGRVMEVIDYGTDLANENGVDQYDPASDFAIDFGLVTDSVVYCAEDYGVLVV